MKKNKIYLLVLTVLLTSIFTGCSESFLDEEPVSLLSLEQKEELQKKDPSVIRASVFGMYANLHSGTNGYSGADNFGQKAIDLSSDLLSGDISMTSNTYGWFSDVAQLTSSRSSASGTHKVWRYYYLLIKSANDILDGTNDTIPINPKQPERTAYAAQAKFIRGYAYYNLLQFFAGNYDEWKDKPAIPYYRTQRTVKTEGLSTPKQVMEKTIKDLELALKALEASNYKRRFKFEINVDIAKGILAYCKLYVGDNQGAADLTAGLLDLPFMSDKEILESGFNSIKIPGWLWAIDVLKTNTGGLRSFWGHMDVFTYSYAWAGMHKAINTNLYAKFSANDVRKKWFDFDVLEDGKSKYKGSNYRKFYSAGRVPGGDRNWTNDICYMRAAEMLLINAEANARLKKDAEARKAIDKLLLARTGAALPNTIDNATLLEEIHKNWRFEMWGEGKSLAVMKRFKATTKKGDFDFAGQASISYNDKRLTYEIPENEIVNNPKIK